MQNEIKQMFSVWFLIFTNIANQTFPDFVRENLLYSILNFIVFQLVYQWLKVHSSKLCNIVLVPWRFKWFGTFHFEKLWNDLTVSSNCFGWHFTEKIAQCVKEGFRWWNALLVSHVQNGGSKLFGHEHSLHEAVHVASVSQIHHAAISVSSLDVELLKSRIFIITKRGLSEDSAMYFVMNIHKLRFVFIKFLKISDKLSWDWTQIRESCLVYVIEHNNIRVIFFVCELFVEKRSW